MDLLLPYLLMHHMLPCAAYPTTVLQCMIEIFVMLILPKTFFFNWPGVDSEHMPNVKGIRCETNSRHYCLMINELVPGFRDQLVSPGGDSHKKCGYTYVLACKI